MLVKLSTVAANHCGICTTWIPEYSLRGKQCRARSLSESSEWWHCIDWNQFSRYTCGINRRVISISIESQVTRASALNMTWRHPEDLEETMTVCSEEAAWINVFAADVNEDADYEFENLTGSSDFSSPASIRVNFGLPGKALLVVSDSIPSTVADLLQLNVQKVQVMSGESILEVRASAPWSI